MEKLDVHSRVGISEETYLLLKAAKLYAKKQEKDRDLRKTYFRSENGQFMNDKLINLALKHYVLDEFKEEIPGLDTGF